MILSNLISLSILSSSPLNINLKPAPISMHPNIQKNWRLNTSNQGKLREFERLFSLYGAQVQSTQIDLPEIQADPMTVVVHKASQLGEGILIEDTSLDIEGADVGVNVRWLLDHLPEFEGRRAYWRVLLAYQKEGLVYVYEGTIRGTIVLPRGEGGFGFDPVFLPDGCDQTLAQSKPDEVNARAKAVAALLTGKPVAKLSPIVDWNGSWQ
jgi:XTP/dITP diphosphohydrolase